MKLLLNFKIDIDVNEDNKPKEKLSIFFREFTKDEKKEHSQLEKKFKSIFKKAQKISRKQQNLEKKAELYELNSQYKESIAARTKIDSLEEEVEQLDEELSQINGEDPVEFGEESAKKRFDKLISGDDKEKLRAYAEGIGYASIMKSLDAEKVSLEKKQFGE